MYYDFTSPVKKLAGYQVLALDRGEREEFLKVTLSADENYLLALTLRHILKRQPSPCGEELKAAAADSLSRLILPSLEREIRSQLTETAANQAIDVFALNLRHLLMQPPVKGKVALGLDPAYRHRAAKSQWWMPPAGCWRPLWSTPPRPKTKRRRPSKS